MVCLACLREMVHFLRKKKIPWAVFTHREVPYLTSLLTTWHTSYVHRKYLSGWQEETEAAIEKTCSLYIEEFHEERKGDGERERGGKIYLRISAGSNKSAMEKYWYFMHGNTTMHLKNINVKKKDKQKDKQGTSVTWNRWNWKGERVLLWDKWAVFFNIDQSSVKWIWMELGVNDRVSQKDI